MNFSNQVYYYLIVKKYQGIYDLNSLVVIESKFNMPCFSQNLCVELDVF